MFKPYLHLSWTGLFPSSSQCPLSLILLDDLESLVHYSAPENGKQCLRRLHTLMALIDKVSLGHCLTFNPQITIPTKIIGTPWSRDTSGDVAIYRPLTAPTHCHIHLLGTTLQAPKDPTRRCVILATTSLSDEQLRTMDITDKFAAVHRLPMVKSHSDVRSLLTNQSPSSSSTVVVDHVLQALDKVSKAKWLEVRGGDRLPPK